MCSFLDQSYNTRKTGFNHYHGTKSRTITFICVLQQAAVRSVYGEGILNAGQTWWRRYYDRTLTHVIQSLYAQHEQVRSSLRLQNGDFWNHRSRGIVSPVTCFRNNSQSSPLDLPFLLQILDASSAANPYLASVPQTCYCGLAATKSESASTSEDKH